MKIIPLTQGQFAQVDDEDFEWLTKWDWGVSRNRKNGHIYAMRSFGYPKRVSIRMHREILNITDKNIQVDHIDHNTLNNQRYNLRKSTHAENQQNRTSYKGSSSIYLGVSWSKEKCKWEANIKTKFLGYFISELEAAIAYNKEAHKIYGDFANLNKVNEDMIHT